MLCGCTVISHGLADTGQLASGLGVGQLIVDVADHVFERGVDFLFLLHGGLLDQNFFSKLLQDEKKQVMVEKEKALANKAL